MDRRESIKTAAVAIGGLSTVAAALRLLAFGGEGDVPYPLFGRPMEKGEIVTEESLAQILNEQINDGVLVQESKMLPTIVSSLLYYQMLRGGVGKRLAEKRANNVSFLSVEADDITCPGVMCVLDSVNGLGVEMRSEFLGYGTDYDWQIFSAQILHEGGHITVQGDDRWPFRINLGWLGKLWVNGYTRGFTLGWEKDQDMHWDLKHDLLAAKSVSNGVPFAFNLAEEFYAQWAGADAWNHLRSMGLIGEEIFPNWTAYTSLWQGVVNARNTVGIDKDVSWREFWGQSMDPEHVAKLHYAGDMENFYRGLGEKTKEWNEVPEDWSNEDTVGLGVLTFACFALVSDAGCREILMQGLRRQKLDKRVLLTNASYVEKVMSALV